MSRKYINEPIIEAVCEFRLPPDSNWDLTIPGLIYEKIKDEFPHKEQRLFQDAETIKQPQGIQHKLSTNERILFFTDNRKVFIQVGRHLLAINSLKPYPSWDQFKPKIEKAFKSLIDTIAVNEFQRIGLRYINLIQIPGQTIDLDKNFEFRPFLGTNLPQNMTNFVIGCELPFFDGRDSCTIQLTRAVPEQPENSAFILDLDYFNTPPRTVPVNQALDWVENAHLQVEENFEGCITENLRMIFQEFK